MVYLPADDYENYREDFYLSALTGTDGLTAVNLRPETVYVADGVTLIPVSAGRTAVSFTNALGYSLRYLCHCGIVDVAVPITVGDQYLGAVMFGQVRISNGSDAGVERLVNEISAVHTDDAVSALQPDLRELYQRLPEMEYERIRGIADMINAIVQYIVACAVDNRARMMSYEWRLRSLPGDVHAAGADVPVEIHALTGKEECIGAEETVQKSSMVYPAVVYIEEHLHEIIPMHEMASLCHLSRSYFSRLFQHDIGENYTDYVNRRKVERAKELLRSTPDSVSAIASALGFLDVSYFVKLFKRFEGVTPLTYRKLKRSSSAAPSLGKI